MFAQAKLASEFYHQVKLANPGKNIILTGHSRGGGLAGLVAELNGLEAVVFDNMPFELVASNAREIALRTDQQIETIALAKSAGRSGDIRTGENSSAH